MEALAAVSLASNILQFVEFAGKLVSRSTEIYHSADGRLNTYTVLEEAAENLTDLSRRLREESVSSSSLGAANTGNLAERQLLQLCKESREITMEIVETINQVKANAGAGSKALQSVAQAIRCVWNEREIKDLETRLQNIRQQINTALLFSLRARLSKLPEDQTTGLQEGITQLTKDNEQRHIELLHFIAKGGLHTTEADNISKLSEHVESVAQNDSHRRFRRMITARLRFAELPDRFESIPEAHKNTFSWIFQHPQSHSGAYPWTSFTEWLRSKDGNNLYWITGKPGSGKSTMMKYLSQDPRTIAHLRIWSGSVPLLCSGFFFWNSGTVMQMSRLGLLQTLLYETISQIVRTNSDHSYLQGLFEERWEQFEAFGGGRNIFTWLELRRIFERLLSDDSKRFFFVIDGLDEFDGNTQELNKLIINASRRSNVKICIASRPWVVFEEAFEGRPSLLLEQLTSDDIRIYVTAKFEANKRYQRLKLQDPEHSQGLIRDVARKSAGVFLWVYLVVESLLHGIVNADNMSHLQSRLDALPSDLEALFEKLLGQMDPDYFRHGCQYFRMLNDHWYPPLICFAFADDDNISSSLIANVETLPTVELEEKAEIMERRLKSRCMGLLEVFEPLHPDNTTEEGRAVHFRSPDLEKKMNPARIEDLKVRYLHRTARDFLQSPPIWERILQMTGHTDFDTDARWANGFLWTLKVGRKVELKETTRNLYLSADHQMPWSKDSQMPSHMWLLLSWCIEYAVRMERRDGKVRLKYLDEVSQATFHNRDRLNFPDWVYTRPVSTFAGAAAVLGLEGYVKVKLKKMSKEEADYVLYLIKRLLPLSTYEQQQVQKLGGRDTLKDCIQQRHRLKNNISQKRSALFKMLSFKSKKVPEFV